MWATRQTCVRVACTLLVFALLTASAPHALARSGNYLIVAAQDYVGSVPLNQFIDEKTGQGFDVSLYAVPAGTSRTTIKAYIQLLWGGPSAPDYVLLVGDTDGTVSTSNTIPHWTGGGSKSATTDLPYACMDAGDDWFPDIFVGRWSVRTVSTLQDVVDKSLCVEGGNYPDPTYAKRAAFLATDDSSAGAEETHDWVIANYMDPAEFISTRIYAAQGGNTGDVADALNAGSLFTVYFGHSGSSGWWSPSFNQTNIGQLTNADLYGLVFGFSCSTAHFDYDECFGETWLRASNKGAAAYISASTFIYYGGNQWEVNRRLEKYFFEAFFVDDIWEVGPAWQAGLYRLLADPDYGESDVTRNVFEMFVLLGDPSLRLPGGCPDAGTIELNRAAYLCEHVAQITVEDCGLDTDSETVETVEIVIDSESEPLGEVVVLTETGPGTAEFNGGITLSSSDASGVLQVAHGDTVTATYIDEDSGSGQFVVVTDTARVDCVAPQINNVMTTSIGSASAVVVCEADEPVRATVHYGLACAALDDSAASGGYDLAPETLLTNLAADTRYYFAVEVEDQAGNVTEDDNGGACYTFRTAHGPTVIHDFPLDADPGWPTAGEWAFGTPTGQGGSQHGYPDPTSGATGDFVYGVNLNGDYSLTIGGPYYVTLGPVDLTNIAETSVRFQRWLNTDYQPYVYATIEVSGDGFNWTSVWENGTGEITDAAWSGYEYDISGTADNEATVFVRWGYRVANGAWAYSGWNVDDIQIWGTLPVITTPGDLNCDGLVNAFDIDPFVLALTDPAGYESAYPDCNIDNADCNDDGLVNAFDIDPFVLLLTGG